MAQKFTCPSCGAGLDYDGDDDAVVRCAYCGSSVVVPAELRAPQPAVMTTGPLVIDLRSLTTMAAKVKAVRQLALEGRLPEAAQLYQQALGASPEDSAAAVRQLAAGQSVVISSSTVSASVPTVSGPRVVAGEEAAQLLREQLGMISQVQRQAGRAVSGIVIAAVIGFLIVFAIVFVILIVAMGR